MFQKIKTQSLLIALVTLSAQTFSGQANAKDIPRDEADASIAYAKTKCQELPFDSASCTRVVANAKFVDRNLVTLCLGRPFDKDACLTRGLNKSFQQSELDICSKKPFDFLDCIQSLGTSVTVIDRRPDVDHEHIRWQVTLARKQLEQGRYNEAYRLLLDLENALDRR